LERILLKLALTDDDNELQNVVARFLVPVLYKISSPQPSVQKKVRRRQLILPFQGSFNRKNRIRDANSRLESLWELIEIWRRLFASF
jgi:hypothetical protein